MPQDNPVDVFFFQIALEDAGVPCDVVAYDSARGHRAAEAFHYVTKAIDPPQIVALLTELANRRPAHC